MVVVEFMYLSCSCEDRSLGLIVGPLTPYTGRCDRLVVTGFTVVVVEEFMFQELAIVGSKVEVAVTRNRL